MELWDAYDDNFNKIEGLTLIRGDKSCFKSGVYHLVVDIGVIHQDGCCLLMQRDLNKSYPGCWQFSAGGSALKGESSVEAAIRELKEETGIISNQLIEVDVTKSEERHTIYKMYLCITDIDKDSIVLQENETINYKWVSKDEVDKFVVDENLKRTFSYIKK